MAAPQHVGAAAPGPVTPCRSDNARDQAGVIEGQVTEQRSQYAGDEAADQARKADATLIARAALAGVELVRLADGTWIASGWGMLKPLTDAEVGPWLQRVAGVRT
jgi:hypothetical protein